MHGIRSGDAKLDLRANKEEEREGKKKKRAMSFAFLESEQVFLARCEKEGEKRNGKEGGRDAGRVHFLLLLF